MTVLAAQDRVGRYVIEALIGQGGMGAVYRAFDDVLRRRVALKLVGGGAADPEAARRILREARMAASLDHPNVVSVFDIGEHEGTPFIVMELVLGVPLRAFVGAGPIPVARRVRWLVAVARALAAAHARGLVHRDIKPENVMVREDGAIKVLDFGIAAPSGLAVVTAAAPIPVGASATSTFATLEAGRVAGTPIYMAPEVLSEGVFDARSDQFAWGVLAYELLLGVHPWPGATLEARLRAMQTRDAPPVAAESCGVAVPIGAAVDRALARDRADRFVSMDELIEAIGESVEALGAIGGSLPPGPSARSDVQTALAPTAVGPTEVDPANGTAAALSRTPRAEAAPTRRRRRAIFVVGFLVAAGAGAAAIVVAVRRAPPRFEVQSRRRIAFGAAYSEGPSLSRDGRTLVYDAGEAGGDQLYHVDLTTGVRRQLTSGKGWHYRAAVSPSGDEVAYISAEGNQSAAYVLRVDGSGPPRRLAFGNVAPAWSPDGSAIWAGEVGRPTRFDAKTLERQRVLVPMQSQLYGAVLEFPDGKIVARAGDSSGEGLGIVLHAPGAPPRWIWRRHVSDSLAIVPGRPWLFVSATGSVGVEDLWQIPIGDGEPRRVGGAEVAPTLGIAVSADGKRMAWSTTAVKGTLVSLAPSSADSFVLTAEPITERRRWADDDVRAVPGSSLLLVRSDRDGVGTPWVIDPAGRTPPRQIATGGISITGMDVSPDASLVAFASSHDGIFVTAFDGSGARRQITHGPLDEAPAFAADGKTLFFQRFASDESPELDRVPVEGGEVTRVRSAAWAPATSPDGTTLLFIERGPENGRVVRLLDLSSGAIHPLDGDPPSARYFGARFSRDGRRVALYGGQFALEIDRDAGRAVHRFDVGMDQLTGVAYTDRGLVASIRQWDGDVWIADGLFR